VFMSLAEKALHHLLAITSEASMSRPYMI